MKKELLVSFPLLWGIPPDPLDPALVGVDVICRAKRTCTPENLPTAHTDLRPVLEHLARLKAEGYSTELIAWPDGSNCVFVYRGERTLQDDELQAAYRFSRQAIEMYFQYFQSRVVLQ